MGYRNNSLHHFNDILAENEMKPVISKVAGPYSEEYIRQFDEGELRNPFTRADGPVYRIAQLFYDMPTYGMPEMSILHICRFFNVLNRVIQGGGSREDEEETVFDAKELYDSGNLNMYKCISWCAMHSFLTGGLLQSERWLSMIPDFGFGTSAKEQEKIRNWNQAVDMQSDVPEKVRQMFKASKSGDINILYKNLNAVLE